MALTLTGSFRPGRLCREGGLGPRGCYLWGGSSWCGQRGLLLLGDRANFCLSALLCCFQQCVCETGEGKALPASSSSLFRPRSQLATGDVIPVDVNRVAATWTVVAGWDWDSVLCASAWPVCYQVTRLF